ncbi:MAG TPA: hypothetical protein VGY48_12495 [Vicinamibacterales bacterium]|jgi:hypothetical protein|nr:hypothetical protein [Vicinamibacterales bacterium]
MLPDDVVITKQSQDAIWNPDGTSTSIIRVQFMVGKHGPFTEKFQKDGFNAAARDAKLTQFAYEVR